MNDEIPFDQNLSQDLNTRKDLSGLATWISGFPDTDSKDLSELHFDPVLPNRFQKFDFFSLISHNFGHFAAGRSFCVRLYLN